MNIEEATNLVLNCTATGHTNLPLWQYLPGMQVTYVALGGQPSEVTCCHRLEGIGTELDKDSYYLVHESELYDDGAPIRDLRPDFTDDLTVQALWLLVRRAYSAAADHDLRNHDLRLRAYADHVVAECGSISEHGTPVEVFARLLAAAPVKS